MAERLAASCGGDVRKAVNGVELLFAENPGKIAAVIVEPVAANMGVVEPAGGFLKGLRRLCDENGAALIFDEVITGFRLALGGAQEYFGVKADLVTFGKIIGGGMPVGAYCGSRALLEQVAQALMERGPAGFAVEKWSAGETAFDQASGMFWGKLQAVCRGMLVAGMEESGELEGFTVRGEVTL